MVASAAIAFIWAFCEGVFFFIVPDVWLTWLAISKSSWKKLSLAIVCATFGAILGGIVVYQAGKVLNPDVVKEWLDHIPGISPQLIESVARQVEHEGIYSYFKGMWGGNPYKIYAFFWGVRAGNLWQWLMISVLARATRFILATGLAVLIDRLGERFIGSWTDNKKIIFGVFWACFYGFYFSYFK